MLTLRIFVSSPGDVAAERAAVRRVLDELEGSHLLRGKVSFELVAWDDPYAASPMEAGVTPQESVNRYAGRPAHCDLTLVILWSRIGTVLPPGIVRADGSRYASGTVWEFEDAMNAHRPVWLYRRTSKPQLDIDDADFDAKRNQYAAVNGFFSAFSHADGALGSGINSYAEPADFARQLRQHLEAFVNERLSCSTPVAQTSVSKPVLRIPPRKIVGRAKLVNKVVAGLTAGLQDFAFVHLPGVGKTAVTAELLRTPEIMQRFPDGVLWAHLGQDADVTRQLGKWAKALGLTREEIADCTGPAELGEAVVQAIDEARILLVVDDVWTTEAGQWFMLGAPNCARVISTRYKNVAQELMPRKDAVLTVDKLNSNDGFDLLADLAPHVARSAPDALRQLVARVDGLPIALVLIGKMLAGEDDAEQATRGILQTLTDIGNVFNEKKSLEYAETRNFSLGEVIEASYSALGAAGSLNRDRLPGEQLRSALEALAVLRPDPAWFPLALARLVTGASDPTIKALVNAGLIEKVRYHSDAAQADDEARFTMHRMIAEYVRTKLSPERLQALNHLAADYYLAQLTALEKAYQEDDATSYSIMYRYEDPEWQDSQDNWLYYFAQTGYDREANFLFLRTWFDGFWWWSCFTAEGYDFCDELLNNWDARLSLSASGDATSPALSSDRIERLMRGLELLRTFKRAYPKETEDRSGGAWSAVKAALNELRQRAGLDSALAQLDNAHARHVRALTDVFLAEAERFGKGDSVLAENFYREALALFREAKDHWNVAWVSYHLADMLSAGGRHEDARPLALAARDVGQAGRDHEVVALAQRLLGDMALAANNTNDALHHYQRAIESAYRFQIQPEDPDAYTLQFYAELTEAIAGRLRAHYATMPAPIEQIAQTIRQTWLGCGVDLAALPNGGLRVDDVCVEALAKQLFPPSLPPGQSKADTDAYAARVKAHLAAIPPAPSDHAKAQSIKNAHAEKSASATPSNDAVA